MQLIETKHDRKLGDDFEFSKISAIMGIFIFVNEKSRITPSRAYYTINDLSV